MDTTAKSFIKLLEQEWRVKKRITGSHHIFFHKDLKKTIPVPFHKKDLWIWLWNALFKQAQLQDKKPKK